MTSKTLSISLLLALAIATSSCEGSAKTGAQSGSQAPPAASAAPTGQALYGSNCAMCHQPDGRGVMGSYPPLDGSEWLAGEPDAPIAIVLAGLKGDVSVKGELFSGEMPPLDVLSDADVAHILTYVRTSWSNSSGPVTTEQVGAMRKRLEKRKEPWNGEAEIRDFLGPGASPSN